MNVLYLTHRLPYAPNRGDRIRSYHLAQAISRFATIDLFSFVHDDDEARHVSSVPVNGEVAVARVRHFRNLTRGALSLPSQRPLTHALLDAPDATRRISELVKRRRPDVVLAHCSGMARFAFDEPLFGLPLVLDLVDVDSTKWAEYARRSKGLRRLIFRREAATLRRFEAYAARRAHATLVVSERERAELVDITPDANVVVVPLGIDRSWFAPPAPPSSSATIVFCGMMDYFPNVAGIGWFVEHVWPRVQAQQPDARLLIVGANPTRAVRRLAERDTTIEVTGRVADVRPYLWSAAFAIAPLHVARGVQCKVLEAVGAGIPVVITPSVREGLPPEIRPACDEADSPEEFAAAVVRLLAASPDERRQRATSADVARIEWARCLAPVRAILSEAAGAGRTNAAGLSVPSESLDRRSVRPVA